MTKTLFYYGNRFTISGLHQALSDFTLYNGCLPSLILLTEEGIKHYQGLLFCPSDKDKLTFNGIKIKQYD